MSAKDIFIRPIPSSDARRIIEKFHYSGKTVQNSQLNIGVFVGSTLEGALQFGPSMDGKRMSNTVRGSRIGDFLELNRMAFGPRLPRNSESRALAVSLRLIKKHSDKIKWIVTFADGTQCGDGTIYRASGFNLIGIKKNTSLLQMPNGVIVARKSLDDYRATSDGRYMSAVAREQGAVPLRGFQLKYIKFLDPTWEDRLAVPIIPYSAIADAGAAMYRGVKTGAGSVSST